MSQATPVHDAETDADTQSASEADALVFFVVAVALFPLAVGPEPNMAAWRKRLFIAISRMTSDVEYFGLPADRTLIIGARIEL